MCTLTFVITQTQTFSPFSASPNSNLLRSRDAFTTRQRCRSLNRMQHMRRSGQPTVTRPPTCSLGTTIASIATACGLALTPLKPTAAQTLHDVAPVAATASVHTNAQPLDSALGRSVLLRTRKPSSPTYMLSSTKAVARQRTSQFLSSLKVILPRKADCRLHFYLKCALLLGITTSIIVASTIAVFWVIQDSLVYKPTKVWRGTPKSSGMPYYEDVNYCTIDGVEISGWFIKQPPDTYQNARIMIYFHGTDKNASFRLKKVIGFYEHCKCNVLLLSYRGYGLSTGKPNERGFRIDAESAYDYLESRRDIDVGPAGNLWVYGESLGGAVAIHFSNVYQHCINALILENTFTSLLDMIKLEFPILGIFRYLSRNKWQSKKRIGNLYIPLLFLSGLQDSYIPPRMMKQMYGLAEKSMMKQFVEFERGTHNRTWTMDGFYESVARFMDEVELKKKSRENDELSTSVSSRGDESGRFARTA